jgi:hypothetical protein
VIEATREHLKEYGVTKKDALRLERALCTIVDLEGPLGKALADIATSSTSSLHYMCDAIRLIIDGKEKL